MGIINPTEIQEKAIPVLLQEKRDLIGLAQTGTGKTAAFGLPLLDLVDPKAKHVQALILSPTRELGQQIATQLEKFSTYKKGIKTLAVYGGANIRPQIQALKGRVQVVIATPGRLIDLIDRKAISLSELQYLVLDEADEMLNMGFKQDIDRILRTAPADRSTWLFSATMPSEIRRIIKHYMKDDREEIKVSQGSEVNKNIDHQFTILPVSEKVEGLCRILDAQEEMRGIVFCRTKAGTQKLAKQIVKAGYRADALHGDLSQNQRDIVMQRFRDHQLQVLIATDVAARGIDVDDLTHVIHFNLPDSLEYYTHRSGRTARAGKQGISLVMAGKSEKRKISSLEKMLKVKFKQVELPGEAEALERKSHRWVQNLLDNSGKSVPDHILQQALEALGDLTKEEVIKRLIAKEFEPLLKSRTSRSFEKDDRRDGRDSSRSKNRRKEKDFSKELESFPDRSAERRSNSSERPEKFARYFINLGKIDNLAKRDLVDMICSHAGIDKSLIGNVELSRNHSYFEVAEKKAKHVSAVFKGTEFNGRPLRVNRDDEGGTAPSFPKRSKGKKGHRKEKRRK